MSGKKMEKTLLGLPVKTMIMTKDVIKFKKAMDKIFIRESKILDQIRDVRTLNNTLWINVMRVAMKHAPAETKKLIQQITTNDRKVSALTARLAGGGRRK
jgi:hypothetical protein